MKATFIGKENSVVEFEMLFENEEIEKQLNKLVEVIQVQRLSRESFVERELALFKLAADTPEKKAQVIQLVEIFSGKFVTVGPTELGVEISGRATQIDNFTM